MAVKYSCRTPTPPACHAAPQALLRIDGPASAGESWARGLLAARRRLGHGSTSFQTGTEKRPALAYATSPGQTSPEAAASPSRSRAESCPTATAGQPQQWTGFASSVFASGVSKAY